MKRTCRRKILGMVSGMALAMLLSLAVPAVGRAYVQASGMITADAAKVRKEPSTQSDSLSSLLKGTLVTVIDEVKDSAGALWYKVSYENSTGYVRSDLMLKATANTTNTANTTTSTTIVSASTNGSAGTAKPAATQVTAIAETKAYVNFKSARVRQGASTQHEILGSAEQNTPVVITGEAKAPDGKKWYQIKYTNQNGREIVGFIRSDLVTVGDPPAPVASEQPAEAPAEVVPETPAEAPAETPAEVPAEGAEGTEGMEGTGGEGQQIPEPAPAPEPAVKPDYEMAYMPNKDGVEEWFLLDNIAGTQQSLANLRAAAEAGERLSAAGGDQAGTQKIIIIVLAVLVAVLAVVVAILLFKLKDMYEEEDDEEEDDEEDEDEEDEEEEEVIEEPKPVRKKRPVETVQEKPQKPVPKAKPVRERRPVPEKAVEYDPEEEFEAGQPAVQKPQTKRKAKNFLIEDDEFEFEFLNMDDKK